MLLVVDILDTGCGAPADADHGSIFPDHVHHIVAHKAGFTEDAIRMTFATAGLLSFYMAPMIPIKKHDKDLQLFLAKGTKPLAKQPESS